MLSSSRSRTVNWTLLFQCLLIAGVFAASWVCLQNTVQIGSFEAKYQEEFGNKPLPPITEWILRYRMVFLYAGLFFPLAALATFAIRDRSEACCALLGLIVLSILVGMVVYGGLRLPLVQTMKQMASFSGA
jgi:hypothetical protein